MGKITLTPFSIFPRNHGFQKEAEALEQQAEADAGEGA